MWKVPATLALTALGVCDSYTPRVVPPESLVPAKYIEETIILEQSLSVHMNQNGVLVATVQRIPVRQKKFNSEGYAYLVQKYPPRGWNRWSTARRAEHCLAYQLAEMAVNAGHPYADAWSRVFYDLEIQPVAHPSMLRTKDLERVIELPWNSFMQNPEE